MNKLSALIKNFNMDCHKQYTKVSGYLGDKLDDSLKNIEKFYYSDFWANRFRKRLKEEGFRYYPLELDCILGSISYLREETKFQLFVDESDINGKSDNGTAISLNVNSDKSNVDNIIMHEFGHRQYNQQEFVFIKYLNELTIGSPGLYIKSNQSLEDKDYPYFTDDNELRQRIIPIVKEMYDNNWTAEEAYELSENLKKDDIRDIFTKDYIVDLLNNIL